MLKRCVSSVLHSMGMELVRSEPALRARWLAEMNINLVLDVGANTGQYATEIRKHGFAGRVISMEPVRATFDRLARHAAGDPMWTVKQAAAGSRPERATINLSGNTTSSSLLAMKSRHAAVAPESAYVGQEQIEVIRLDSLVDQEIAAKDRVWLKLDVQGYEFAALEGATRLLPQVYGLECELSVVPLYEQTPLIGEAIVRIEAMGFRLVSLYRSFWDFKTKHALMFDGVFLRERPSAP